MNEQIDNSAVQRAEPITLTQRSVRRREYELRRGDQGIGWLRFPPGRRSVAQAQGNETGSLTLVASSGGVDVRGGPDAAAMIATVEAERRGTAVIRMVRGPAFGWRRTGRRHRWAVGAGEATLLRFVAAQGLLKSSVRITAQPGIPDRTVVLLCLIGGFLALRELQAEADGSAAVAGIVATGAG